VTEPLRDFAEQLSEALCVPVPPRIRQTMETGRTSSRRPNPTNAPRGRAADFERFITAVGAAMRNVPQNPNAWHVVDPLPADIDAHAEAAIRAFPPDPDWINWITDAPCRFAEADRGCQRCLGFGVVLPSSRNSAPCPACIQPRIDRGALIQEHGSWNDYLRFLDAGTGPSRLWIPD